MVTADEFTVDISGLHKFSKHKKRTMTYGNVDLSWRDSKKYCRVN